MFLKNISVLLILSVVCLLISCEAEKIQISCGISEVSKVGINHLQPLADAMEKYKSDNNRYPESFEELLPKYISKIPIIATGKEESIDTLKFDVLINEKLFPGLKIIENDGSYFKLEFIPTDNRICLLGGRNNICEYTSEKKQWGCYQH
jgi:hypothetical protein